MKKKEYIKPEISVLHIQAQTTLAGSFIQKASEEDYEEDNVSSYRDSYGSYWAN